MSSTSAATVLCPVCVRRTSAGQQALLCAACANSQVEPLRNSCYKNEKLNVANRNTINAVFAAAQGGTEADRRLSGDLRDVSRAIGAKTEPPLLERKPSEASVKQLSLQLIKLELINAHITLKNIQRSRDAVQQKVIDLNEQIVTVENDTVALKEKVGSMKNNVSSKHQTASARYAADYTHLRREKTLHIEKQLLQLQQSHYKILKEVCFSSAKSNGYIAKLKTPSAMLLFNQPVIRIDHFFGYNNKLFQLNEYLENLILLQVQLLKVFEVLLPYVDELRTYLPDKEFYTLVQKKENFMVNGGEPDLDDDDDLVAPIEVNEIDSNERIIKLGNTIKLPLSSKTINNQLRRASQARPPQTPKVPETEPKATPKDATLNKLAGKKMIIVPHRILTKPFTKLDSKEYLKFLLVVVKILVNFRVFLAATADTVPRSSSFVASTLTSTVNQLRSKSDDRDLSGYNLEKILTKVGGLDDYFTHKVNQVQFNKDSMSSETAMAQSQMLTPSTSHSASLSSSPLLSYVQDSREWKEARNYKPENGFKALYKRFTEKSHEKPPEEIYGAFSAHGPRDTAALPFGPSEPLASVSADSDLKSIMQDVHQLMLSGHASASALKNHRTLSVMAQSRAQLDDWDVVSKMYHI